MTTTKSNNTTGMGCIALFVTPFFLVGCVTTLLLGKHVATSLQMRGWPQVEATVRSVEAREISSGDDGTSWEISADYKYAYEGREYSGKRVGISDDGAIGISLRRRAALLQEARKAGQAVPCYVKPNAPDEAVLFPQIQWDHVFFLGIVSLVFGGVGVGGYVALWFGRHMQREEDALKAMHPDQPWAWKPDWNRGVIRSGSKAKMIMLWVFAGFWNAVSSPVLFVFPEEWAKGNRLVLIGLLFPLVGAGLLVAAIRATLLWLKYGRTEFVMRSVPGVIGGDMIGAVRIPEPVDFEDRVKLTLHCIKKVTSGSGKSRSTSEKVLWQREQLVDRTDVRMGPQTLVPVVFAIPYTCRETNEDNNVEWRLEASGATPGLDFQARFEIPVFKTSDSREEVTEQSIVDPVVHAEQLKEAARTSRVHMRELGGGRLELDVPPPVIRSPRSFISIAVFTLIFTAICVFLVKMEAPLLFPVVFGLFNALFWLILIHYLTGRKRTRITSDAMEASSRFLCFWSRRTIPAEDIHRVEIPVTSRAQSGSKHYLYYSVRVFYRGPRRERHVDVADAVASKAEAEWIAAAVENALLQSPA